MIRKTLFSIALVSSAIALYAQEIIQPNYGLKSPETIELIRISMTATETSIDMSIENRIKDGYFCIDRNTYLISDRGDRLKLSSVSGLPYCPDVHSFSSIGDKVYFSLRFPRCKGRIEWFNLIEECGDNCLGIYAITINPEINASINKGFAALNSGATDQAIKEFEDIRLRLQDTNHGILGSIYLNLIDLYYQDGNSGIASKLVSELKNSSIPEKNKYLRIVSEKGYKF